MTNADMPKITFQHRGSSTLGGREVWFDRDVLRLNYDGRGEELGEFHSEDQILVILQNGDFYTTNFDLSNHYDDTILIIEKYNPQKVWTVALYDADQKYPYLKRFQLESSARKQNFLGENPKSRLLLLTDEAYPRIEVVFGGGDAFREALVVDAESFIAVKGFKAKGKRLTMYEVETINELEPERFPDPVPVTEDEESASDEASADPAATPEPECPSDSDLIDEVTGQMKLF